MLNEMNAVAAGYVIVVMMFQHLLDYCFVNKHCMRLDKEILQKKERKYKLIIVFILI